MSQLRKLFIIFAVTAVVVVLNHFVLGGFLKNLGLKLLGRPVGFATDKLVPASQFYKILLNFPGLAEKNLKLKEENQVLISRLEELESVREENDFLRIRLGVASRNDLALILARITAANRGQLSSTLVVNKGSDDGVKRQAAVVSSQNILIGVVDDVFNNYANVLMVDDPRLSVSVRVSDSDILASTTGIFGKAFSLKLVGSGEDIKEGDLVSTSGLDGLPAGLPLGRISEIKNREGEIFKQVNGRMLFDSFTSPGVFIAY